jgi:hypothetical protein
MPELFAPGTFIPGSSIAHRQPIKPTLLLMEPIRKAGEVVHTISDVDKGIMTDLGWEFSTDNVVPEPSSLAIFAGTGICFFYMVRRRKRSTV